MPDHRRAKREHVTIGYDEGGTDVKRQQTSADGQIDTGILPSDALGIAPDNCALAISLRVAGSSLRVNGVSIPPCAHDIPEGHRFTTVDVPRGGILTSWGIPIGEALVDMPAGSYLCNVKSLKRFRDDNTTLTLPDEPTFKDMPLTQFRIDEADWKPAEAPYAPTPADKPAGERTFMGFHRPGGRGVGTRNYVVIIGVTSRVSGFAKGLERRFTGRQPGTCDGVVAVAHTESGSDCASGSGHPGASTIPANRSKVLRALAGFAVHPNVAGVLLLDEGDELPALVSYIKDHSYPLEHVPHRELVLTGEYAGDMNRASSLVEELLAGSGDAKRVATPLSSLVLAQQCGGSDAFSGISANPLVGWIARRLVAEGGGVLLAETDELIGAEGYVLDHLEKVDTGKKFLGLVARFYRYTGRFGASPEGNPSGGNLLRGLYNITLKSAGAAMKKFPDVRLDRVIEYAERVGRSDFGYGFMDSPGNDLESIAGQVASGSNIITFTTGNGAITNFPFVPTVKVLTTTKRYQLLSDDMDINAGQYIDGTKTMDQLGNETLDYVIAVVSGMKSKGELAGHHQVQLWRTWQRVEGDEDDCNDENAVDDFSKPVYRDAGEISVSGDGGASAQDDEADGVKHGVAFQVQETSPLPDAISSAFAKLVMFPSPKYTFATERVGLLVPTSLCSSHVSVKLAERLREAKFETMSRVIALPHTEGCGVSGSGEKLFVRTMLSYASHPMVAFAVLVEHGCEKTHNNKMKEDIAAAGGDPGQFGYASIQLDGGIEKAYAKVLAQFKSAANAKVPRSIRTSAALSFL